MPQIPFGVDVHGEGAHPAAWRDARGEPRALFTPQRIRERFRALDDSALAFATIPQHVTADAFPNVQGQLDSIETAVFASAVTSRIALVTESNAIHSEPYHLANQVNTLDWSSAGRSGWIVGTDDSAQVAASYGREPHADPATARRETREVIAAVRRLWDTWEDDIFLADETTYRFLDLDRWHYADVEGEFFSVKGPGLLPRPPQGQIPVWSRTVDATVAPLVDIALVAGTSVERIAEEAGPARDAGVPRVVAEVEIVLDAQDRSAAERLKHLDRATPWGQADRLRLIGTADEAAERLAELATHVDGVRLHPAVIDVDVPVVVDTLLPALERADVLLASAPTQRELFRLPRPDNIFATA